MGILRLAYRFRELRRSPRYDVNYLAHIDVGADAAPLSCIISDLSTDGARLTVGTQHEVPDELTLVFRRRCRVVRRADGQVGVEFV